MLRKWPSGMHTICIGLFTICIENLAAKWLRKVVGNRWGNPSLRGICRTACATSLPARRGALANDLKLTALRPLGFSRTSPYRSKLLTALHEKSPALCAELQIVCGEGGIRTPGASQLNSFQDCRNRPLYHLSSMYPFGKGVQRYATIYYYASISPKKTSRILLTGLSPLTHAPPKVQCC